MLWIEIIWLLNSSIQLWSDKLYLNLTPRASSDPPPHCSSLPAASWADHPCTVPHRRNSSPTSSPPISPSLSLSPGHSCSHSTLSLSAWLPSSVSFERPNSSQPDATQHTSRPQTPVISQASNSESQTQNCSLVNFSLRKSPVSEATVVCCSLVLPPPRINHVQIRPCPRAALLDHIQCGDWLDRARLPALSLEAESSWIH